MMIAACPNCSHAEYGAICPECDCGDPTNVVGPHTFPSYVPTFAERRAAELATGTRCQCGRTVWLSDVADYCPDCAQFNPRADHGHGWPYSVVTGCAECYPNLKGETR